MRRILHRRAASVLIAGLAWGGLSCGTSRPLGPTQPVPTNAVILFANSLSPGGRQFFSFVVDQPRTVNLTLASTMADFAGPATPTALSFGLGTPSGTDCALTSPAATVAPALLPQISLELTAGTYCVRVQDPGTMTGPLEFAVRIVIVVGQSVFASPGTDLFSTSLAVRGATSRNLFASRAGVVALTLQGLGGGASQIGVGIGIPRADGSGCFLTQSVLTSAGASHHIAASVTSGQYCVRVFDPGTLTNPVTFALQIEFP